RHLALAEEGHRAPRADQLLRPPHRRSRRAHQAGGAAPSGTARLPDRRGDVAGYASTRMVIRSTASASVPASQVLSGALICREEHGRADLMGSVSLLRQDGSGSGWRVSTLRI